MREIFRSADSALVGLYESMLADSGIATVTHNLHTQQAIVGGIVVAFCPLPQFHPALSVVNDADYPEAMRILGELKTASPADESTWKCPQCGEEVPSNFASCWNCSTTASEQPGPH